MASNFRIISGGQFVKNPVVVEVYPGKNLTEKNGITFLRMKMKVIARLVGGSEPESSFEFSVPAKAAERVQIDISSALRAVTDNFEYQRTLTEYPYVKYSVETWEEYMKEGDFFSKTHVPLPGCPRIALMGGFSDEERWLMNEEMPETNSFTRKPNIGEIVAQDETLMYPVESAAEGQHTQAFTFEGLSGNQSVNGVHQVYVVPPSEDRYHFFFVNGLGIIETIAATSLAEESKEYKSQTNLISRMETMTDFSRITNRKTSTARVYKMSSGPISRDWLDWWLDEFLMTEQAWVRINGHYYPCVILPAENTLVRKNASPELMEVTFNVRIQGM